MQHLFGPAGVAVLAACVRRRPLLAFDFDGTLAPIVAHPDRARIPRSVSVRLAALARRLPVAIVTGRSVDDVRGRLGFAPTYVVGNHGAQDSSEPDAAQARSRELEPMRAMLHAHRGGLVAAGVLVEDKGQSIALHYRQSRDRERALALIHGLLAPCAESLRVFGGKMVVNVTPSAAPDKAHAVHTLLARSRASCALFAGDDVNDEPVFESAPADWVTVRIGRYTPSSRARFFLDSTSEVAALLGRVLALLGSSRRA